jgi:CRISPR-associated protein Csd1
MLVQALAAYADTYLADALADAAFEEKPVPYALQVDEDGTFAGILERREEATGRKTGKARGRPLRVPKSPVARNTGLHPLLACDSIQYVLGPQQAWTPSGKEQNHRERNEAFVEFLSKAAKETDDSALRACATFYCNPAQVEAARLELATRKPDAGSLVALAMVKRDPTSEDPGGPIVERKTVRNYWSRHYAEAFAARNKSAGEGMCLISGRVGPIAATHDKIKGLSSLGGQPAGVSLMSFDKPAFRSYGWEQNANSPVSPERASAYVLALNDLLRIGPHRRGLSQQTVVRTRHDCAGTAFLFWTRQPSDDDLFSLVNDAQPDDVQALLIAPHIGSAPTGLQPNDFYLIAVAGNGGRMLVRYWFHDTLAAVQNNVAHWFSGLRIADVFHRGEPSAPPKLWELLLAISGGRGKIGERIAKVPPDRAVQFVRRALHGLPLGRTILAAALARLRVEKDNARLSPVRIGLVRMCVNDIETVEQKGGPLMADSLQPDLAHPAYVCGRLLALYESLQYAAQGEVNVTVADRYYGMASTFPQVAFPKLATLGQAHMKKLRRDNRGASVRIEREIGELMTRLTRFPAQLNLEDQGRFAIGFHHQKADQARRIQEAKARKAENVTSEA